MATPENLRKGIFPVSAPPRPEAPTKKPSYLDEEISPAPFSPKKPEEEKRLTTRRDFIIKAAMATGGLVVAGGIGEMLRRNFTSKAESVAPPFDLGKLDTERQTVVFDQNQRWATPEDIQNHIQGPKPKVVSYRAVEAGEKVPGIPLILSIGSEAETLEVYRKPSWVSLNGKVVGIPMNLGISVKNEGVRFGPVIPEGINTSTGELFIDKGLSKEINGALYFYLMYEKFKFANGKYLVVSITANSLMATNFLKNAPFIDPNKPKNLNWIEDVRLETGLKFNIADNPAIFINTSGGNIVVHVASATEDLKGYSMLPEPKIIDGKLLINPLR